MAWTQSAYPRGESASAQANSGGLGTLTNVLNGLGKLIALRGLPVAAALHLLAIAAAVLVPASPPLPLFLTVTGLALVVLSLSRPVTAQDAKSNFAADAPADLEYDGHALALERQSQRLVEIADAATRARRDAEMRGQLWAELTARMSHELRTPLNAVIGFSDMMNAEIFGPLGHDRYRDYTRHIRECGRDLLKSAEDTLALTSSLGPTSTATSAPLGLAGLLDDAWTFFADDAAQRRLVLDRSIRDDVEILGERRPVRQILINLFAEAISRTPDHGTICVRAMDDGSVVMLDVRVATPVARVNVGEAPLAVCIARVLLEQQGSGLLDGTSADGTWHATTFLDRAVQKDFFG